MANPTAADVADELEQLSQVERAVSTWDDCDIAALVEERGDIGPVGANRDIIGINELNAAPFVLVKANLRYSAD